MQRLNCWEFDRHGKETCCMKRAEPGTCPAATESRINGVNNGINGGRACWAINILLNSKRTEGALSSKLESCFSCGFYALVQMEEGRNFMPIKDILKKF